MKNTKLNPDFVTGISYGCFNYFSRFITSLVGKNFNHWWVTGFSSHRNQSSLHKSSECKALVVWGTIIGSTAGYGRLTKQISEMIKLPPYQYSVIVGLILSDGWLRFISLRHKNAQLGFEQSGAHGEYVWAVFGVLSPYCNSYPIYRERTRNGKTFLSIYFFTRSLPCMNF